MWCAPGVYLSYLACAGMWCTPRSLELRDCVQMLPLSSSVLSKAFNLVFNSMLAEINVFQAPAKPQETASQKAVKAKETLGHSAFSVCSTFFHSLAWNSAKGSAATSFASYDGGSYPGVFVAWLE